MKSAAAAGSKNSTVFRVKRGYKHRYVVRSASRDQTRSSTSAAWRAATSQ